MTVSNPAEETHSPLQPQVVVYGDLDILLRPEIAFGRLDRGMAEEEFDLLQIPAVFPTQLGAGAAEVVGALRQIIPQKLRQTIPHPTLTAHTAIPRESEIDFLTEAEAAFAPLQPKKTATKKTKATTPIKAAQKTAAKKTTAKKDVAA